MSQYVYYFINPKDNKPYMDQFVNKMQYMSSMANHSHNDTSCTAVFMSYFASPVWAEIECDYYLKSNYFLCEINTNGFFAEHPGMNIAFNKSCRYGYSLVNGYCWTIVTWQVVSTKLVFQIPSLTSMICAWSLGDPSRNVIGLQLLEDEQTCLKTNDSYNHRYKDWILQDDCNTATERLKQSAIINTSPCQGNHFR